MCIRVLHTYVKTCCIITVYMCSIGAAEGGRVEHHAEGRDHLVHGGGVL